MDPTVAGIAAPNFTNGIELSCVSAAETAAAERRRAYELGFRQNEARVATARQQAERWKQEATWWKEEYEKLHVAHCAFVAEVADKYGLK